MLDADSRKWILKNLSLFTPEVKEMAATRLRICEICPELTPKLNRCKKCGCVMPIKVFFKSSSCPLKKWEAEK